jgi:hypothetical protein
LLVCKLEEEKLMSWLASGDASANYSIDSSGLSMALDGTHQEIDFFQDRSSFTSLFKGWHLISREYSGEGTNSNGEIHAVDYSNQSIFFSFGYDWYHAEFARLQPYISYGFSVCTYSRKNTTADGTVTP